MITNAIQSIVNPIVDAYPSIIQTDNVKSIACIHTEELQQVLLDKQGIFGYIFLVTVDIIAASLDDLDTLSFAIINALSDLSTMIDSTSIEETSLQSSTGLTWNDEAKTYINTIIFNFQTKNL